MASSTEETIKDSTGDGAQNPETKEDEKKDDSMFECNICLDTARDAVVSMCGHLFWWVNIFLRLYFTSYVYIKNGTSKGEISYIAKRLHLPT